MAGFRRIIDLLRMRNLTADGIDAELESKRLHALVDGLVVHKTTFAERLNIEDMLLIVSHHLDSFILKPPENNPSSP